jgi:hypothetical protein
LRDPGEAELAYSAPLHGDVAGGRSIEDYAQALGVDVEGVKHDSGHGQRAAVLRWLDHSIRTKPTEKNPRGLPRRERVARCGSVWTAKRGDQIGLAHKWCNDRMCPVCTERRANELAAKLKRWCEHRWDRGAQIIFPTLTQVKQEVCHESAEQAVARLYAMRREMMNDHSKAGRELRSYFRGGVWFCELSWSYRGKRTRTGARVAFDGWHPHLHGLIELEDPPPELEEKLGPERARIVWAKQAGEALRRAWLRLNPEAASIAQAVEVVDRERVGQVTKYPCAPFGMANPERSREAALALARRRMHDAWGSWRSWKKAGGELLDRDREARGEAKPEPIVFGDVTLQGLAVRCSWDEGQRPVYFHEHGEEDKIGVPAVEVVASIQQEPRTFQRQEAEEKAEKGDGARGPPSRGPPC